MEWALPEWTVLAVIREQPRHGFAVAAVTARGAELGRVWQIPRPVIYRALRRLEEAGMVATVAVESGAGPQRTIYEATGPGRDAVDEWLRTPVEHVRDIRSQLLMKLALLDRRGIDPQGLLERQLTVLEPVVAALSAERDRHQGFDVVLLEWRYSAARAATEFVAGMRRRTPAGNGATSGTGTGCGPGSGRTG